MRIRMRSPAFRHNHDRAQIHRMPPEFREHLALHPYVLHPFGIFRRLDGLHDFRQMDLDRARRGWVNVDAFRDAVEIAGLGIPMLAFAFVHGELDGVAVRPLERGVFVQHALHPVVTRRQVVKAGRWVTHCIVTDDGALPRRKAVHIRAKNLLGPYFLFEDLESWLRIVSRGNDGVNAPVERSRAKVWPERYGEARLSCASTLREPPSR